MFSQIFFRIGTCALALERHCFHFFLTYLRYYNGIKWGILFLQGGRNLHQHKIRYKPTNKNHHSKWQSGDTTFYFDEDKKVWRKNRKCFVRKNHSIELKSGRSFQKRSGTMYASRLYYKFCRSIRDDAIRFVVLFVERRCYCFMDTCEVWCTSVN